MAGGRKLAFCKEQALDAAMQVFWKKGFHGASLADLTEGMGINKPSMYATFGNKEELFVQATEYYMEKFGKSHTQYLHELDKPLKERLQNYLMSVIAGQCNEKLPKGCYISLCVAEAAGEEMPESALETVSRVSLYTLSILTQLFAEDSEARDLGLDNNAEEKALFLVAVLNGTAVMARAGKNQQDLSQLVSYALAGVDLAD